MTEILDWGDVSEGVRPWYVDPETGRSTVTIVDAVVVYQTPEELTRALAGQKYPAAE